MKNLKQIFFLVNTTCVRVGAGSGSVVQIYSSAEQKEIYMVLLRNSG
jgi:hypothetical protein